MDVFPLRTLATQAKMHTAMQQQEDLPSKSGTPFPIIVAKGAGHCGSGCMIGDIVAEWLAFFVPAIAAWLGWHTIFADKMYAVWLLDFAFAFLLGLLFQYFAIVPMRNLSPGKGIIAALKADTQSLIAWQVGMYGFIAFAASRYRVFGKCPNRQAERSVRRAPPEITKMTGTSNVWASMSIDQEHGILSLPVSSRSQIFGGNRTEELPLAISTTALDAKAGKLLWTPDRPS